MTKSQAFYAFILGFLGGLVCSPLLIVPIHISAVLLINVARPASSLLKRASVFLTAFAVAGFFYSQQKINDQKIDLLSGKLVGIEAKITKKVNSQFYLGLTEEVYYKGETLMAEKTVGISTYKDLEVGEEVFLFGSIIKNHDYYNISYPLITERRQKPNQLDKAKQYIRQTIHSSYPEPYASLVVGILIGDRTDIPRDLYDRLIDSGTVHIVALSGFNIAIVAEVFRRIFRDISKRMSLLAPVVAAFIFVAMAGFSASASRALFMLIFYLLSVYFGRKQNILRSLVLAAFIIGVADPLAVTEDIGFQLSFSALAGIIIFTPMLQKFLKKAGFFAEPIAVALGAQVLTLPLILYHFGRMSVVAVPANLLIVELIPPIMFFGSLSLLPIVGTYFAVLNVFLLKLVVSTVEFMGGMRWASLLLGGFSILFLISYAIFAIIVAVHQERKAKLKPESSY